MKEILEEYGSGIVVAIITATIVLIINGISIYGTEGIVGISGVGVSELTKEDNDRLASLASDALDAQSKMPEVEISIKLNPSINEPVKVSDLFSVSSEADLQVDNVYVIHEGQYVNAALTSPIMADYDSKVITFLSANVYFVEVLVWEDSRLSKKLLRVNVEEK